MPKKNNVAFIGRALDEIKDFPTDARQSAGYQIDKVQNGNMPDDWKSVPGVGVGVKEIRIWESEGTYRVIYVSKYEEAVYVLHAFSKKSDSIPKETLETIKSRYKSMELQRRVQK